jgi:hypothetical protein
MSFDEEEERRYLGAAYMPVASVVGQKQKKRVSGKGKEEDDGEEDSSPLPAVKQKQTKKQKTKVSILEDDDDEEEHEEKAEKDRFGGKQLTLPMRGTRIKGGTIVPSSVQQAVSVLFYASSEQQITPLSKGATQELNLLVGRPDEFTKIDPVVVLCGSISTGPCRIRLKEMVPYSYALMARALNAQFIIQITEKVKTRAQPFDLEVVFKPYKSGTQFEAHTQPFGCEAAVQARLDVMFDDDNYKGVEFLQQVNAYMYSLGPLSSVEACDVNAIELNVKAIQQIMSGELKPLVEKPKPRHLLQQQQQQQDDDE